jgi:hypothetical protein
MKFEIKSKKQYRQVMNDIYLLMNKGESKLNKTDRKKVAAMSAAAEKYEDKVLLLKPATAIGPNKLNRPDLSKFRKVLFWDTSIEKIDWEKQKRAVIERVFERGNQWEKDAPFDTNFKFFITAKWKTYLQV